MNNKEYWFQKFNEVADELEKAEEEIRAWSQRAWDAEDRERTLIREKALRLKTLTKIEQERDDALTEAECHDCIRDAAVIEKPLTVDDITDEEQYEEGLRQAGSGKTDYLDPLTVWLMGAEWARKRLAEPQRPKNAEDIQSAMEEYDDQFEAYGFAGLADHLAERGFQFVEDYSLYCGKGPCALENGHDGKCRC